MTLIPNDACLSLISYRTSSIECFIEQSLDMLLSKKIVPPALKICNWNRTTQFFFYFEMVSFIALFFFMFRKKNCVDITRMHTECKELSIEKRTKNKLTNYIVNSSICRWLSSSAIRCMNYVCVCRLCVICISQ